MGKCCSKTKYKKTAKSNLKDDVKFETSIGEDNKSLGPASAIASTGPDGDLNSATSSKSLAVAFNVSRKFKEEHSRNARIIAQSHDELTWVKFLTPPPRPEKFPYYVTVPVEELHMKLFQEVFQILLDENMFNTTTEGRKRPPLELIGPEDLRKAMDCSLPNLPVAHSKILEIIRQIIRYQPRVGHTFFMEQRFAGLEPYAVISDLVATVTNANNVLYIVSTVTTLLELELIRAMSQLVGYDPEGDGDGAVTTGATLANGYAMRMAVKQKLHHLKHAGVSGTKRPCFFVSESQRYIQHKCSIFQGFGMDSVIPVREDQAGRMLMDDLRAKVSESINFGYVPCMVVGTGGTTVFRSIDPLDQIADFCKEHDLWFHCDATYGGALLLSSNLRDKLKGVERSDSFTWSQHFVIGVPPTSTVLVVPPRHKHKLTQYLGLGEGASYGFMKTPLYDPRYDISHNTIISCRRPEMFKFWFVWKAKGVKLLGKHVDHIFNNASFCLEKLKEKSGFEPILDEFEGTNVCFYYVPRKYRTLDSNTHEFRRLVSLLTVNIRRILVEKGKINLNYFEKTRGGHPTYLVLGLHNSAVSKRDILYVLEQIRYFGEVLSDHTHIRHVQYHELIKKKK